MSKEERNQISFQAYDDHEDFDISASEKELLRAILVGALQDIKKPGLEQRKATEFFLSPEDDYVFSFLSICDFLSLDPTKVLVVAGLEKGSRKIAEKELIKQLKFD
jgi:hypothetical protein